ncbi:hypothetical protein L6164_021850 [Bauhinia variegata]|uniref:Uncharacterized protein n=1 Tax=Bauhinia variegata TaxID=167791 RepID=A0ACB9MDP0_BAUVA|nr:hypothetical protein L6164_021850 [Bauhinia variegata]
MAFGEEYQQEYECLLFDVDDTLYPSSSGLSAQCSKNILEYMVERLGIDEKKVIETNQFLYKNYGTSMAGLKAIGYDFDYDDYHRFVHGRLPYEKLNPDFILRTLLHSLPIRKVIFSNGDKVHVAKVLRRLGLEDCFERIICFETLNNNSMDHRCSSYRYHNNNGSSDSALAPTPILCKPHQISFELALKIANINSHKTLFFDDSICNIEAAKRVGLHTVLVGSSQRSAGVDFALESIHNMKDAVPELWKVNGNSVNTRIPPNMAMETSVLA